MSETHTLRGTLCYGRHGEAEDLLAVRDADTGEVHILAEWAEDALGWSDKPTVSVRYWTADHPMSPEAIKEAAIRTLYGGGEAYLSAHYSEVTGYLWTDEVFTVGGHDLIRELASRLGKYLHLEVETHAAPPR